MIFTTADFKFESPLADESEIDALAYSIEQIGHEYDADWTFLFGHNHAVTGIRILRPTDAKLVADIAAIAVPVR